MPNDKKQDTSNSMSKSLQTVAKDSSIVFIGSLLSLLSVFIARIIITRYWTTSDYGLLSLASAILTISVVISTLGLIHGVSRHIAYVRGKKEYEKISSIISTSIWSAFIVSIFTGIVLLLLSEWISIEIFHEPALINPLRIFAMAVPIMSEINIIVSIFRGFSRIKPLVYFQQILLSMLFPIFIVIVIFLNLSFFYVFYAHVAAIGITLVFLIIYSLRQSHTLKMFSIKFIKSNISKDILLFSIPLLFSSVLGSLLHLTDTLMLGSLKNTSNVGLYNAALPSAHLISFPLASLLMIYVPIFSGLYAKHKYGEMRRNYMILTKWLVAATLPLFAVLFLYPEQCLTFLYGSSYVPSAGALRILAIGYIFYNLVGPCGASLIGLGKSRFIMFASLSMVITNIVLNTALIPIFGIAGAAIATTISIGSNNLIQSLKLYTLIKAKSLSKNLIKPMILSIIFFGLFYILLQNFASIKPWMIVGILVFFYMIFALSVLVTKSLDKEDLKILQALEKKNWEKIQVTKTIVSQIPIILKSGLSYLIR